MDIDVPKDSDMNDTQIFIERYLKDINTRDLLHCKTLHKLIADAIGTNNKFILMDNTGYYKIINEKQGHWKDNVWFSNYTYQERVTWYGTRYTKQDFYPYSAQKSFWDDDDYYEDSYNTKKDDEFDLLTPNEYINLEEDIDKLTIDDFIALDTYPVVNRDRTCLMTYEQAMLLGREKDIEFLEEVSPDLYEYYLEKFYAMQDKLEEYEEEAAETQEAEEEKVGFKK